ncbi:hypothetical protein [Burkholderia glumae]|uniref:hypothetical protein n=1 Tax=Burkholderia glumae TaxID=337 RepID=UPI0001A4ADFA|nr:hypothetical protein [Burkholderia glumae]ACR28678.1 Hypothetical protein bglu_1g15360 [Burkholderia glumae BGR1]
MRALSLPRPRADNALLAVAARRSPLRYVIEGAAWAGACGVGVGALWYSALLARAGGWL